MYLLLKFLKLGWGAQTSKAIIVVCVLVGKKRTTNCSIKPPLSYVIYTAKAIMPWTATDTTMVSVPRYLSYETQIIP